VGTAHASGQADPRGAAAPALAGVSVEAAAVMGGEPEGEHGPKRQRDKHLEKNKAQRLRKQSERQVSLPSRKAGSPAVLEARQRRASGEGLATILEERGAASRSALEAKNVSELRQMLQSYADFQEDQSGLKKLFDDVLRSKCRRIANWYICSCPSFTQN